MTTYIILGIIGWLACSVVAYLLYRHFDRQDFGRESWTCRDRASALRAAALGPLGLFAVIIGVLPHPRDDRPAKW